MPRPRKHDPSIPTHIEQRKLPIGVYWNKRDRYWYTLSCDPKPKYCRIAGADALMSDLHKAMELARGIDRSTLDYMLSKFAESPKYKKLAQTTQDDYGYCRLALQHHKTKLGCSFAELRRAAITTPLIQLLIDAVGEKYPSKANHIKRYLSAAYKWGIQRMGEPSNPALIVEQVKERGAHRMPDVDTMRAVVAFLRERGALPSRRKGSVPPYVWAVAEIAYRCRMRSVEVRHLTDANKTNAGIIVDRVKGSDGNLTRWCPELEEAWSWLVARRAHVWLRKPAMRTKTERALVVSEDGAALSKSALNSAWRRAMTEAMKAGLINKSSRFGLHGLKHRGVTDTPGTKADKKEASGHKTDAMLELYDHERHTVNPAGKRS